MLGTPAFRPLSALRRWLCGSLPLEPLGRLFDLRLDAGEVHTAQGHQHLMAVQGGFQGYADWCLWEGQGWRCLTLGLVRRHMAVTVGVVVKLGELCLGQLLCTPHNRRTEAVTVDARVAPHTSASKPCVR